MYGRYHGNYGRWNREEIGFNSNVVPGVIANKPGYLCLGAPEGSLVGRIGQNVFPLGSDSKTPEGMEGELELCINDDIDGRYGAGLKDNTGIIEFELTLMQMD